MKFLKKHVRILSFSLLCAMAFFLLTLQTPALAVTKAAEPETITISAAASLKDSLTEVQKQFEASNKNIKLQFNFGGSGALKKQIEEGAPADLFIAADVKSLNDLDSAGLILPKSKCNLLGNDLVLIVNNDYKKKIKSIKDLSNEDFKFISVGTPESVPAGAYAKESLSYYKLWEPLTPKFVFGKDVKQVLTYVESGDAQAGFVYATDAKLAKNSTVCLTLTNKSHSPILYSTGIIKATKYQGSSEKFLTYLKQKKAQDIFKKYGFTVLKK